MSTPTASQSRYMVLDYPVDLVDQTEALKIIEDAWKNDKSMHVVTLNAEMIIEAQHNQQLDRIIRHAGLLIPDGAGVVWALRLAGKHCERVPGIDLANATLSMAARYNYPVALLGGKEEILNKLLTVLPQMHPGLQIVAYNSGYFSSEQEQGLIDRLAQSTPRLLLVALGVPKQEYLIDRWQDAFPKAIKIGVGGSFDVWTGATKRAPLIFQRMHLEWLYRLVKEPWRFGRMSSALPSFGFQVLKESILGKERQR